MDQSACSTPWIALMTGAIADTEMLLLLTSKIPSKAAESVCITNAAVALPSP